MAAGGELTLIEFELPVIEAATVSVAVMVSLATVFSVAEKLPVPLVSIEFAGKDSLAVGAGEVHCSRVSGDRVIRGVERSDREIECCPRCGRSRSRDGKVRGCCRGADAD